MHANHGTLRDDAEPMRWEDMDDETRATCIEMIKRLDEQAKRAHALDERLRTLLTPEQVDALGVANLTTEWDEAKLAAFEALAELTPQVGRGNE